MTEGVASPSVGGSSAQFQILSGTLPFGGALWFKFLGANANATHFVLDLALFTDNPAAPQALEYNVSQSTGGSQYNFSTQCDMADQLWRVWDPVNLKWVPTSVPCVRPTPSTWNHLVWEFERDTAGNTIFSAVSVNGVRSVVNISMPHVPDSTNGIDVAFQADANIVPAPYSVWLDQVTLTYW
jgi:hypothetical protein